ncbi:hypothetical protein CCP2SC5_530017 [Azospirillaceae bacterium]
MGFFLMVHFAWSPEAVAKQRLKGLFLVLMFIAGAMAAAVVLLAVWEQNRLTGDMEQKDARAALVEASEDFGRMLRLVETKFWFGADVGDERASERDNGQTLSRDAQLTESLGIYFDMIIAVDANNHVKTKAFNIVNGSTTTAMLGPGMATLIAQARGASARQIVHGVGVINGAPCLVSAVRVKAEEGARQDTATVLALVGVLSSDFVAAIGERFGLPEFRWRSDVRVGGEWERFPLLTLDGVLVGEMTWRSSGSKVGLLLPLLFVISVAVVAVGWVAWRIRLTWMRHDRQASVIVQHLATVLDQTGDAILTCDSNGALIGMNRAAEFLLERSAAEIIGRSLSEIIVVGEEDEGGEEELLSGATPRRLSARQSNGELIPIELRVSRIEGEDQTIVIAILRDDRERQYIEDALKQVQASAELAERSKTEFISNISHELRTPLNAIIGFADLIRGEVMGPIIERQYVDFAGDIFESGNHLLAVINDVIDLAGVEYGREILVERPLLPVDVVGACVRLARERAARSGIALIDDVDPGTPGILADEAKVKQMLIHLLSNAIKFSSVGGTTTIRAGLTADGELAIAVSDMGVGIAPENIGRVLTPFTQEDSSLSRRFDGAGLGLPLTRILIEQHGGRLTLVSRLGVGTTATLIFPRSRVIVQDDRKSADQNKTKIRL